MPDTFRMSLIDVFQFKDGRTVLVGQVEDGPSYIGRQPVEILEGGELRARLMIEGEMLTARTKGPPGARAISTTETSCFDRESLGLGHWMVRSAQPTSITTSPAEMQSDVSTLDRH